MEVSPYLRSALLLVWCFCLAGKCGYWVCARQSVQPSAAWHMQREMQVFTLWFQMIKTEDQYFRRLYDKKLCCAGLLCIFNLPSTAVPPAISGALDKVWCRCCILCSL